eukprot:8125098-Alexandrium_andersonii.AAC.1
MRLWSRQMRLNRGGYRPPGPPPTGASGASGLTGAATAPPDPPDWRLRRERHHFTRGEGRVGRTGARTATVRVGLRCANCIGGCV